MTADYFDRVAWRGLRRAGRDAAGSAVESFAYVLQAITGGWWGPNVDRALVLAEGLADDAIDYFNAAAFLDWKREQVARRRVAKQRRDIRRIFEVRP